MQNTVMLRRGLGIFAVLGIAVLLWFATRPPPLTVQGEVSADRVDISARVAGRVVRLGANVGDTVEPGQILVEIDNPQLVAALASARASLRVAEADLARVSSIRPEMVAAREADVAAAKADVTLYQEVHNRQAELSRSGSTPQARLDEATRNLEAASRKLQATEAALQLARTGASPEERALAAAQVEQTRALLAQRDVDVAELIVRAAVEGEVSTRVAAVGENFSAGAPLFSLINTKAPWFTFNLREDLLNGLHIGSTFNVTVPALDHVQVPVRVTVINVQGQYATWRATRATGDFDLRTFEVRAVPVTPVAGLRPGMSVIAAWSERDRRK